MQIVTFLIFLASFWIGSYNLLKGEPNLAHGVAYMGLAIVNLIITATIEIEEKIDLKK